MFKLDDNRQVVATLLSMEENFGAKEMYIRGVRGYDRDYRDRVNSG